MAKAKIVSIRSAACDEYGELSRQIDLNAAEMKPARERLAVLEAQINGWYADESPDLTFVTSGALYTLAIGPKRKVRSLIQLEKLYDYLGRSKFLAWATFPLSAFDRLLAADPDKASRFVKEERGKRVLTATPRAAVKLTG